MTAQYHRELRRRVERLEAHFEPGPEPRVYQCWMNLAGDIEIINGPGLCWCAKDHPGSPPPPIPAPWHLPPPITITLLNDDSPV